MFNIYLIFVSVISFITMLFFLIDKISSKKENRRRIPESVLLFLVSFGGATGGVLGLLFIKHKSSFSRKFHFAIGIWFSFIVQIALGTFMFLWENGQIGF